MKHRRHKSGYGQLVLICSCVLAFLVLISSSMTAGLYAKYTTSANGSAGGHIIEFNQLEILETGDFVNLENGNNQFVFIPGVPLKKEIRILFGGSEAATIVFVEVNAPNWTVTNQRDYKDAGEQLTWSVAAEWNYLDGKDGKYIYYQILDPNETLESHLILNDKIEVSRNGTLDIYAHYAETKFTVTAYVVQATGFDSVGDAWNSLKNQ